ncbi:SbtA family thio(seleno)oxazole RiPP natural product precursor [Desulfococcaceae bacterium HSG9]|jgi:radical SAM modification target selenobiotic family peptide|nr:SbtA family thio(seleno)oxazole RiPP natural product precursor [Desulfococcaceae bacterium HSG9]
MDIKELKKLLKSLSMAGLMAGAGLVGSAGAAGSG